MNEHCGSGQEAVDRMIQHWRQKFELVLPDRPDLIVVPECCDRYEQHGSQEAREYCEARGGRVLDAFADVAGTHRCYLTYPAARLLADGTWRNSIQIIDRSGQVVGTYDKHHPLVSELEDGAVAGGKPSLIECDFGRVACAICFDLNFDALRLHYARLKPDLVVFCSVYHGGLMQQYWAYSCRAHLVSAVSGLPGHVISPVGRVLASTTNYHDFVTVGVNLDCCVVHLDCNSDALRNLKRAYGEKVTIFDPGLLGSVLVTSEAEDKTACEMLGEFGVEQVDDYFARSLAEQAARAEPGWHLGEQRQR